MFIKLSFQFILVPPTLACFFLPYNVWYFPQNNTILIPQSNLAKPGKAAQNRRLFTSQKRACSAPCPAFRQIPDLLQLASSCDAPCHHVTVSTFGPFHCFANLISRYHWPSNLFTMLPRFLVHRCEKTFLRRRGEQQVASHNYTTIPPNLYLQRAKEIQKKKKLNLN